MTYLEDTHNNNLQSLDTSNLIFIDTNLTNYQSLIPVNNNDAVYLINSQQNGIEQITEVLERYSNLNSIQILSHGDAGYLQLGNSQLSVNDLNNYQDELATWGKALSPDGDLLFYGCNVGAAQEGAAFVNQIASLTSADVAASKDLTGNIELGGDWDLEVATGNIETESLNFTDYEDVFLSFNLTYDANTTLAQKQAFELAAKMWSNVISDNVTVNIHLQMAKNSDLPAGTLGGAIPFFLQGTSYTNFRNALINDKTTSDDTTATNSLETGTTWSTAFGDNGSTNFVASTSTVAMSRSNAKALGLIAANNSTLDGLIVLNDLAGTGVGWQYNYSSSTVGTSSFDFTSVAMHEIGHVLGFMSAVDGTTTTNFADSTLLGQAATSLDLFRYVTTNGRDLRTGYTYFSLDKGVTHLTNMSYGSIASFGGDGYQGSHWLNPVNAGLMDPVAEKNVRGSIGNLDLQALDAIGWNRVASTKSVSTLTTEANNIASTKGNVNRNSEINTLLANWRWARGSSTSTLRQEGNIAQFLAQQGFFSVGAFRESFDFSLVNTTEDASQTHQTQYIGDDFLISLKENFATGELANNLDLDSLKELLSSEMDSTFTNDNIENEAVNYQDILTSLTQWLEQYENSELNLEDLQELLQQPELVAWVVESLDN